MNWYKKAIKERIPGGRAKGLPPEKYDSQQMEAGERTEMEHTMDPAISKEISRDHLEEFPTYYTGLKEMEKKLEEKKPARRGRYPGQDENVPRDMMGGIIEDNELVEGEFVKKLRIFARRGDWDSFKSYLQELKDEGHSQTRLNSMMTRSMYGVKL